MKFLAVDFETANRHNFSACAIGLVLVENCNIIEKQTHLIRPPTKWFSFTEHNGISWEDVKNELPFIKVWPKIEPMFKGVDFLAAHNSSFDEGVLKSCCRLYNIEYPGIPFRCTVQIARRLWHIYPTKLNNVCEYLGIPLNHHEAGSDAEACAQILIRALRDMYKKF